MESSTVGPQSQMAKPPIQPPRLPFPQPVPQNTHQKKICTSLLDVMVEGREYESLLEYAVKGIDLRAEIRRSLSEISASRKTPVICMVANNINGRTRAPKGIEPSDDLPFAEMVQAVDAASENVDIILVTPGGNGEQVTKFVNRLRPRFKKVSFILPGSAMSAGTIFCMSGDEIIMDERAYIGPIDPQVPSKNGGYIPAQAILTLLHDIQQRGADNIAKAIKPDWSDVVLLNNLDPREVGYAINASKFSIDTVSEYLREYKFKTWVVHRKSGEPVTHDERGNRARAIAEKLCAHDLWKTHGRGISRDIAENECQLEITHPEDTPELLHAMRRFWALIYWVFENTNIFKMFVSDNYSVFRSEAPVVQ